LIELGPYQIDVAARRAYRHSQRVPLKPRTLDVAIALFQRPGKVLSREALYEAGWGRSSQSRTLDVHVSWLRKALELDGTHGWILEAVHLQGYRLRPAVPRRGTSRRVTFER
jgi:DNA-binding response OmpR family regulator